MESDMSGLKEREAKRLFKSMVRQHGKRYYYELVKHHPSGEWSVRNAGARKIKKVI